MDGGEAADDEGNGEAGVFFFFLLLLVMMNIYWGLLNPRWSKNEFFSRNGLECQRGARDTLSLVGGDNVREYRTDREMKYLVCMKMLLLRTLR